MKDRRLHKGLRCVASALNPSVSKQADPFSLLQSIAAACGVALGDDGLLLPNESWADKTTQVRLLQQALCTVAAAAAAAAAVVSNKILYAVCIYFVHLPTAQSPFVLSSASMVVDVDHGISQLVLCSCSSQTRGRSCQQVITAQHHTSNVSCRMSFGVYMQYAVQQAQNIPAYNMPDLPTCSTNTAMLHVMSGRCFCCCHFYTFPCCRQ